MSAFVSLLLHFMQFFVVAVLGEQPLVGAAFYDAPVMDHTDLIGILDRTQTVGDGYSGTCLHQTFEGILYQSLTFCIEGGGGFVEDKDRGIFQDGTSDGDTLALTT